MSFADRQQEPPRASQGAHEQYYGQNAGAQEAEAEEHWRYNNDIDMLDRAQGSSQKRSSEH